jgi:hypothetical protein
MTMDNVILNIYDLLPETSTQVAVVVLLNNNHRPPSSQV